MSTIRMPTIRKLTREEVRAKQQLLGVRLSELSPQKFAALQRAVVKLQDEVRKASYSFEYGKREGFREAKVQIRQVLGIEEIDRGD